MKYLFQILFILLSFNCVAQPDTLNKGQLLYPDTIGPVYFLHHPNVLQLQNAPVWKSDTTIMSDSIFTRSVFASEPVHNYPSTISNISRNIATFSAATETIQIYKDTVDEVHCSVYHKSTKKQHPVDTCFTYYHWGFVMDSLDKQAEILQKKCHKEVLKNNIPKALDYKFGYWECVGVADFIREHIVNERAFINANKY